jgi:hypothetical protein
MTASEFLHPGIQPEQAFDLAKPRKYGPRARDRGGEAISRVPSRMAVPIRPACAANGFSG